MKRSAIAHLGKKPSMLMSLLLLLLATGLGAGGLPVVYAAQPAPVHVVFYVFERPQDGGDLIATIVTTETFHASDVSTGTWVTYAGLFAPGGSNPVLASGRLTARHSPTGLVGEVVQLVGTKGHARLTVDGVTAQGELAYTTQGGVRGTVHFAAVPIGVSVYQVHLIDPVPPIFFAG